MFSGYVGICRRKKYVGGHPRGPRDRGGAPYRGGGLPRLAPEERRYQCKLHLTRFT